MHGSFHHAHGVPSEPCSAAAAMAKSCKQQGAFKFDKLATVTWPAAASGLARDVAGGPTRGRSSSRTAPALAS